MPKPTICIIGSTGTVGSVINEELIEQGYTVYGFSKSGKAHFKQASNFENVIQKGNVLNIKELTEFTNKCDLVICCYKPSSYTLKVWKEEYPIFIENIISLAKTGKPIIFIDGIEAYGDVSGQEISETTNFKPISPRTQIRAFVSQSLEKEVTHQDLPITILKASPLFGPYAVKSIFGEQFFNQLLFSKRPDIKLIPNLNLPFTFTYTRDLAAAVTKIVEKYNTLNLDDKVFLTPCMQQVSLLNLANQIAEQLKINARISTIPNWQFQIESFFNTNMLAAKDSQYLLQNSLLINSSKFEKYFPDMSKNSNEEAIVETANWFKNYLSKV